MRKSRRLRVPKEIVELRYAYLPWFENSHKIVVEHPFSRTDAQPAIIVIDTPAGETVMEKAVLVIPSDAPHDHIQSTVLVAALGLARSDFTRVLTRVSREPFLEELTSCGWQEPPFLSDRVSELERHIDRVLEQHAHGGREVSTLVRDLRQTISEICDQKPGARLWSPFAIMRGRPSAKHSENWRILNSWGSWEEQHLSREERAEEYYGGTASKKQQEGFRIRLDYLHLKAASKFPKSRKRRRELGMRRHSV